MKNLKDAYRVVREDKSNQNVTKSAIIEMIKELVTSKLDEARKDAHPTPAYVSNKTARGRIIHASASSNFKAGYKVRNRYKGAFSEEEQAITGQEDDKKKKKSAETIDISPEKSELVQAR